MLKLSELGINQSLSLEGVPGVSSVNGHELLRYRKYTIDAGEKAFEASTLCRDEKVAENDRKIAWFAFHLSLTV